MPAPERVDNVEQLAQVLTEAGYTDVTNIEQHGATWHCDAVSGNGDPVSIVVDGSGEVHEKGREPDAEPEPRPEA